jgi:hypothetical protein
LVGAVVGYETFKYDGASVAGSLKGNGETIGGYFAQRFGARELSRPRRRFGLSDCGRNSCLSRGECIERPVATVLNPSGRTIFFRRYR